MLEYIYSIGCGFVLYRVVVNYETITKPIPNKMYKVSPWMIDLLAAVIVSLWPILLFKFVKEFYSGFRKVMRKNKR